MDELELKATATAGSVVSKTVLANQTQFEESQRV
jgi:hypothetical protein